jgi:hypothetical protein
VPIDESLSYAPLVEPVLATQMETGAPKRRRRFTSVPEAFNCTLVLTQAQVATLTAFVATTLQDVLPFDWKDFRDGTAATYVFQKRPGYNLTAVGANLWKVPLDLMKVP